MYALSGVDNTTILEGLHDDVILSSHARRVIVSRYHVFLFRVTTLFAVQLTSSARSHAGTVEEAVNKAFSHETTKPVVIPAGGSGYKVGFLSEYPFYPPITVNPLQSLQVLDGEADAYVHVTKIKKWGLSLSCLFPFFLFFMLSF